MALGKGKRRVQMSHPYQPLTDLCEKKSVGEGQKLGGASPNSSQQ